MKAFNGFLIWVVRFSSRSRSRAALRLGGVALVITEGATPSTEHVLSSDWECGEKLPLGFGGDESRPPGPHLDNGLLKNEIQDQKIKEKKRKIKKTNKIQDRISRYLSGNIKCDCDGDMSDSYLRLIGGMVVIRVQSFELNFPILRLYLVHTSSSKLKSL